MKCVECKTSLAPMARIPLAPTELPYKPGSFKRKLIEAALHGLNVSTLATMAAEAGKRMEPYKNKLMGGKGKTHRWSVRVEGGAIFISDIRPVTA